MEQICRIKFGSHLYGTNTPQSDLDLKGVYIPDGRDILLGRVKGSISRSRQKAESERNTADDVDDELYALQRYLGLLCEGQTVSLDMLFAPDWAMLEPPGPVWREVFDARHSLVTRKAAAFIGYCRQQANKYGIKGSRVAAARGALALLYEGIDLLGAQARLREIEPGLAEFVAATEHAELIEIAQASGQTVTHLDVCGRKMQFTGTIKAAAEVMSRLVDEYGKRALEAERRQGVDWKALSHAVRVGNEALELLATHEITFPLANREHILAIKRGELPYQEVSAEIEGLLDQVEAAAERSTLPAEPDRAIADDIVARAYRAAVAKVPA